MIKKTTYKKKVKYVISRGAKKVGLLHALRSISREKYAEKISASLLYGILSSIAVNFFFQPGHVYSSGATGLAQVFSALSHRLLGYDFPIALAFYLINIPLLILAWYKIGHQFTIFTFITVSMSSFFIQIMPQVTLTTDPLINAIFGGLVMGMGIGTGFKSRISSGGTDIISLTLRKRTGKDVGSLSLMVNGAIFTKQKKMQATIITSHPERVIQMIHKRLHRGVTSINDAEGTYKHEQKAVLITILTREEYTEFKWLMLKADPQAFVSVAENVRIIGRFVEED